MKNDRLFRLLYLLLDKGTMTGPELAAILEVSVRTVYRDVETLAQAGVPVYATAGKGGGISLLPGYSFDKTLLSEQEQNQLLFAVQSLQAVGQPMDALLGKLGAAFRRPAVNWIEVDFSRWGLRRTDSARFEQIKTAILERQALDITYCGSAGDTTRRTIHPCKLIYKDKNWYLQGFCLRAGDFRLFRVGRILQLAPTGELFREDYSQQLPPLEPEPVPGVTHRLTLLVEERAAFRVYDEFDQTRVTRQPDGRLRVEAEFPLDGWVVGYLFSFGTALEVVEPPQLRKQLADYAKTIFEHYDKT